MTVQLFFSGSKHQSESTTRVEWKWIKFQKMIYQDDVIYLVRQWKSISKDRSQCSKEKLICINKLEKITTNSEGPTSACGEKLKPLLNIMVCFALLFISLLFSNVFS